MQLRKQTNKAKKKQQNIFPLEAGSSVFSKEIYFVSSEVSNFFQKALVNLYISFW